MREKAHFTLEEGGSNENRTETDNHRLEKPSSPWVFGLVITCES
jgi:hypothetical protein